MKRSILIAFCIGAALSIFVVSAQPTTPAFQQQTQPTAVPTRVPISQVTPQDLPSLSGVGGTPLRASVRIRQEPSLDGRQIGIVRYGTFIDIVGTNGFDTDRDCNNFEDDLDMWVEVAWNFADNRGWVARCTLMIYGDLSRLPVDATPAPTLVATLASPTRTPGR